MGHSPWAIRRGYGRRIQAARERAPPVLLPDVWRQRHEVALLLRPHLALVDKKDGVMTNVLVITTYWLLRHIGPPFFGNFSGHADGERRGLDRIGG